MPITTRGPIALLLAPNLGGSWADYAPPPPQIFGPSATSVWTCRQTKTKHVFAMLLAILCAVAKIRELFFGHVTQQLLGGLEKLIHFEL